MILDTLLGDSQEDTTSHDVIIKGDGNEQQNARHSPLAADDQRESPIHTCPPLFGHLNRFNDASSVDIDKEAAATRPVHFRPRHRTLTRQEVDATTHVITSVSKVT